MSILSAPDGFLVVEDRVGADKDQLRPVHLPAGEGGAEKVHPVNNKSKILEYNPLLLALQAFFLKSESTLN